MPDWTAWPFEAEDPYPGYRAARERAPLQWHERVGAHLVLSHAHAAAALRGRDWSSDPRSNPQLLAALEEAGSAEMLGRSLLTSDPPAHTRLRSAVNRFFTPRAVRGIHDRVAAIVSSALAPLLEGEPIELMGELAYPIPLAVIAELFDVGLEGAEVLGAETPILARVLELDPAAEESEEIAAAAMRVMLFLVPIVARRKVDPGDDLLSALIHPPDGGVALKDDEIITMCLLLLLAAGPGRLALARTDLVLGGAEIRKGEQAPVVLGAANHDPAYHSDPDRLELKRSGASHLAFGVGPHFCVGAGLARLEAQETFVRLAQSPLRPEPGSWSSRRGDSHTFRRLQALYIEGRPGAKSEAVMSFVPTWPDSRRRLEGSPR